MLAEIVKTPWFISCVISIAVLVGTLGIALIMLLIKNSNKKILTRELAHQIQELQQHNLQLTEINSALNADNTRLKTEYASQKRHWEEKMLYIEQSKVDMEKKFRDISNEVLVNQANRMNEAQKMTLNTMLNPFREQLQSFKEEVNKATSENIKNKSSFDEQFKNLLQLNQNLSTDAQNLTNALRGSKKMQGDWGEVELNRILEISGLQKNIDYFTQENFKNENEQNMRPDVVVKLPNNRGVIVDSKVSMNDYISYVNAEDEHEKTAALQRHIQCIKAHIDELSAKEYQKLLKEESLDYVIIFIPVESAFAAAIKEDNTLYNYAYKKNIALTTPSSLLPILRTVENLWQIENRNKYVQKIADVGGSLYDKLANFVDDMQKIDKSLVSAKQSYEQAISKLSQGKGNALSLATRLKEYGAKANKIINIEFDNNEADETLKLENNSEEKVS
ncbi:MAG: DNA recombination protein RmuC [Alphaproteobacteria bacterium]|nr:DNA recombination protein RmuC [Alphaproteobacteria bacterium]